MNSTVRGWIVPSATTALLLASGCASPQQPAHSPASPDASRKDTANVHRDPVRPDSRAASSTNQRSSARTSVEGSTTADLEQELARQARLETILRVALARNPELAEARERVRAARERAPAASRLPDPVFEYQLWAAPLARPYAVDDAQMHMFGLRQTFPAPGTLAARSRAASEQANLATETRRAREQDVAARVRRAFAEYHRADREYRIHLEHGALAKQVLELTRAVYQAGRGTQQDVLRTIVELSRLHNDVAAIERDRRSARGLLNTLMARRANAPLGPPAEIHPGSLKLRLDQLDQLVTTRRPEVAAAERATRVSANEVDAARAGGRWPTFMVGLQYMLMPMTDEPHNYGAMFSMSLPWLNPRYGEEERAAEASLAADQSALSSAKNAALYELYDAVQRLQAARESYTIIERDLLPQTGRSFEAARALYRGGQGDALALLDALRSLLDVRVERERALARLETALADVERAIGGPIPRTAGERKDRR